eukprot:1149994-Pelagomonas_calceolata.AAC.2
MALIAAMNTSVAYCKKAIVHSNLARMQWGLKLGEQAARRLRQLITNQANLKASRAKGHAAIFLAINGLYL